MNDLLNEGMFGEVDYEVYVRGWIAAPWLPTSSHLREIKGVRA